MDQLYADLKKARAADKKTPGALATHIANSAPAWAAAIEQGELSPKRAKQIQSWALGYDLVEVLQWIENAIDFKSSQFVDRALRMGAFRALRWAGDRLELPIEQNWKTRRAIMIAAGRASLEDVQWLVDNTANVPEHHWCSGLYRAAESGDIPTIELLLQCGARWQGGVPSALLSSGAIDAIRRYDFPADMFGGANAALKTAADSGKIQAIEWVLAKFYPTGDFNVRQIIQSATHVGHLHVLRWLHEERGYMAETFRDCKNPPASILLDGLHDLDTAKWLHELCQFTRAEVIEAGFFRSIQRTSRQVLQWAQSTYCFTADDVRESRILAGNAPWENPLSWILQTFELDAADFAAGFVADCIANRPLKLVRLLGQKCPIDPAALIAASPNLLCQVAQARDASHLKYLHEAGFRTNDPNLVLVAVGRCTPTTLAKFQVLHDMFGIDRCALLPHRMWCVHRDPDVLKALHDMFGLTFQELCAAGTDYFETKARQLSVYLDTYGATCCELRRIFIRQGWIKKQILTFLRDELGMSAERWREDDYAELRARLLAHGRWGTLPFLRELFAVYDLGPADADALLETPDLLPCEGRRLRSIKKKLTQAA